MTPPQRRILAARGGAMGDFIVTLPCLAALRRAFPGARLSLLAHPGHAALAAADGLCDESRSLESAGLAPFFSDEGSPNDDWQAWMGSFDLVVSWLADTAGIFRKQTLQAGARQFLQGPWRFGGEEPVAWQLATALMPLGIQPGAPFHLLQFCRREREDLVAIHPGSGSPRKNWPASHWFEFLKSWHSRNPATRMLVITGESESGDALALPGWLCAAGIDCAHSHGLPLTGLGPLLASCRLYFGHDTGISHLAAACGTPCLLLHGPATPSIWAPPLPSVRVLRASDLGALPPSEFMRWIIDEASPYTISIWDPVR